jgi:hypothetical protein
VRAPIDWTNPATLERPNSVITNPDQVFFGGNNSLVRNPGQIWGGDQTEASLKKAENT